MSDGRVCAPPGKPSWTVLRERAVLKPLACPLVWPQLLRTYYVTHRIVGNEDDEGQMFNAAVDERGSILRSPTIRIGSHADQSPPLACCCSSTV